MDLLGALGILVRVVETGSFSAVARERELSQAAVARQVSQLEEHFGVRLFHRTTRKLSLTDDGEMLLGLARPVLHGVDGLEAALGGSAAHLSGSCGWVSRWRRAAFSHNVCRSCSPIIRV
jgi:Transcriptional regulator